VSIETGLKRMGLQAITLKGGKGDREGGGRKDNPGPMGHGKKFWGHLQVDTGQGGGGPTAGKSRSRIA